MLPELSTTDLLKIGGVYLLTTSLTVLWQFRSSQTKIPKTIVATCGIAVRNLLAHYLFVVVMCAWGTWTIDQLLMWSPLWLVLLALSFPQVLGFVFSLVADLSPGFDGVPAAILAAFVATCFVVFVGPFYFLRQLVVGFVDVRAAQQRFTDWQQEAFTPAAETAGGPAVEEPFPAGTQGVVIATLRPQGKVRIGSTEYQARHAFGQFVERDTAVHVTGRQGELLLVKEIQVDSDS